MLTVSVTWFPICIPLILINEIGKYLSCNNKQGVAKKKIPLEMFLQNGNDRQITRQITFF